MNEDDTDLAARILARRIGAGELKSHYQVSTYVLPIGGGYNFEPPEGGAELVSTHTESVGSGSAERIGIGVGSAIVLIAVWRLKAQPKSELHPDLVGLALEKRRDE